MAKRLTLEQYIAKLRAAGERDISVVHLGGSRYQITGEYFGGVGLPFGIGVGQLGIPLANRFIVNLKTGAHSLESSHIAGSVPVIGGSAKFGGGLEQLVGWIGGVIHHPAWQWVVGIAALAVLVAGARRLTGGHA